MKNKISVVLPVYNGEKYLGQSIQSVIAQTYQNWELIIVNDHSTDNSLKIAEEFTAKDNRIKIISNPINKKLPASLNIGFKEATGNFYTWTSDDNEYHPEAFERMANFLNNNSEYSLVYCSCRRISEKGECGFWGNESYSPDKLLQSNIIGACFLYRQQIAEQIGNYDESMFLAEDHEYWLRMALVSNIAHIDDILYNYRIHDKSLTMTQQANAYLKDIDLIGKYASSFFEMYPQFSQDIKDEIELKLMLRQKTYFLLNIDIKKYSKKTLYKILRIFYKADPDIYYLKNITKLGFPYFFKALKLYFKSYQTERL